MSGDQRMRRRREYTPQEIAAICNWFRQQLQQARECETAELDELKRDVAAVRLETSESHSAFLREAQELAALIAETQRDLDAFKSLLAAGPARWLADCRALEATSKPLPERS